jgi:tetratricopeptide (TPR) repeat protein
MPALKLTLSHRTVKSLNLFGNGFIVAALGLAIPTAMFAHGDLHVRIAAMTEQIAKNPDNARLFLERGELHREHQDWKAAEADYDRAERLDPKLSRVDFCRGEMLVDSGDLKAACAMFDRYLTREPEDGHALVARARALVKLGKREAAVADFTSAIRLLAEPQPEFFLERAQALLADGRVEEALRGLDEGVKRLGPIVTLQLYAIDLELGRKAYDAALARLATIEAQAARKESWLSKRGDIELLMGRPKDARKSYAAALAALDALPPRLQKTRAMLSLRAHLSTALAGTTSQPSPGGPNRVQ